MGVLRCYILNTSLLILLLRWEGQRDGGGRLLEGERLGSWKGAQQNRRGAMVVVVVVVMVADTTTMFPGST